MTKTQIYEIEQGLTAKVGEKLQEIEQLVNKHGSSLNMEIISRYSSLSKVLDDMMAEYDSEILNLKTAIPAKDLDELKEGFQRLQERVEQVDIGKPNVTFIFESDVTGLLDNADPTKESKSEYFFCRGQFLLILIDGVHC